MNDLRRREIARNAADMVGPVFETQGWTYWGEKPNLSLIEDMIYNNIKVLEDDGASLVSCGRIVVTRENGAARVWLELESEPLDE